MQINATIKSLYESLYLTRSNTLRSVELIRDKIKDIPGCILIRIWKSERDLEIRKQFEILIARKINSYGKLLEYNDVPDIYLEYLDNVKSIDAIVELLDSSNEKVRSIAYSKYQLYFDTYLDENEKCKIIEFRR